MKPIKQDTRFNFFINSEIISGGNFKKIIQRVLGGVSGRGRPQALELNLRDSAFTLEIGSSFGAGKESRTPVSTLGRSYNSRYTIPALTILYTMLWLFSQAATSGLT